jgi:hypothetical protein
MNTRKMTDQDHKDFLKYAHSRDGLTSSESIIVMKELAIFREALKSAEQHIFIKNLTFPGWESLQDWDRDISESIDNLYNPNAKVIDNEFTGTIHVRITYEVYEND